MRYIRRWKIKSLVEAEIKTHYWLLACTLLVDKKTSHALLRVQPKILLTSGCFLIYLSICVWASLNLWISTRNLLCRQWSYKEGNWPSKRVHCETIEGWNGRLNGDGNYTCWRLSGEWEQVLWSAPLCEHIQYNMNICVLSDTDHAWMSETFLF